MEHHCCTSPKGPQRPTLHVSVGYSGGADDCLVISSESGGVTKEFLVETGPWNLLSSAVWHKAARVRPPGTYRTVRPREAWVFTPEDTEEYSLLYDVLYNEDTREDEK